MLKMHRLVVLVLTVLSLLLLAVPTFAQSNDDEAFRGDAVEYVKAFGGTVDEAVQKLKLQNEIAELADELEVKESDKFAGLWIEHAPKFRIVVQLTRGKRGVILPYIKNPAIADIVNVQTAPISLQDLKAIHQDLIESIKALGIPAESGINLKKGPGGALCYK